MNYGSTYVLCVATAAAKSVMKYYYYSVSPNNLESKFLEHSNSQSPPRKTHGHLCAISVGT